MIVMQSYLVHQVIHSLSKQPRKLYKQVNKFKHTEN